MAHQQDSEKEPLIKPDVSDNSINGTGMVREDAHSITIGTLVIPKSLFSIILAAVTVLLMVAMTVSLPMYSGAMGKAGSDTYFVILIAGFWFPLLYFIVLVFLKIFVDRKLKLVPVSSWGTLFTVGISMSLNTLFVGFGSLPSRTPPYLQAILPTLMIPYSVIARLVILRRGISRGQVVCCGVVLIGIFISMEPTIFNIQVAPPTHTDGPALQQGAAYWPFVYGLGWIFSAMNMVLIERAIMKIYPQEEEITAFMAWVQVFNYACIILLFWTNFIPGFGNASGAQDFIRKLKRGLLCNYGGDPTCPEIPGRAWLFIITYTLANFSNFLLIRFSDGAVYATVVASLVTPLSAIFWSFFKLDPNFHWQPEFNITTVFVIGGILIITPAVFMYTYFGATESVAETDEANSSSDDPEISGEILKSPNSPSGGDSAEKEEVSKYAEMKEKFYGKLKKVKMPCFQKSPSYPEIM